MGLSFFKIKKEKFLALDIGTEAVKVLIYSLSNQEKIRKQQEKRFSVLASSIQYFDKYGPFKERDFNDELIRKTVFKAMENAYQDFILFSEKGKRNFKEDWKKWKISLSLPPTVFKGRISRQVIKRNNPKTIISRKEKNYFLERIIEETKKEIAQRFSRESGILSRDISWVCQKIIEIKIDGYLVPKLQGYKGKYLEFKVLSTFLPRYYFCHLKKIFEKSHLKISKIVHIAENLPSLWKDKKINGLFLDVGGEFTQIFLVKTGLLEEINEFGVGGKIFSQKLSETLGIEENLARELKERYAQKLLSKETSERIEEMFLQEKREWHENLKTKIKEMVFPELSPPDIFLFGGGSLLPEIQRVLKENKNVEFLSGPTFNRNELNFVYPKSFENIDDLTKKLKGPQSVPSLLLIS